jgi:hypothetical protein
MPTIREQFMSAITDIEEARDRIRALQDECNHPLLRRKYDYVGDGWEECDDCGYKKDLPPRKF